VQQHPAIAVRQPEPTLRLQLPQRVPLWVGTAGAAHPSCRSAPTHEMPRAIWCRCAAGESMARQPETTTPVDITTRTSHYESFTMSGTGYNATTPVVGTVEGAERDGVLVLQRQQLVVIPTRGRIRTLGINCDRDSDCRAAGPRSTGGTCAHLERTLPPDRRAGSKGSLRRGSIAQCHHVAGGQGPVLDSLPIGAKFSTNPSAPSTGHKNTGFI
jgi:hypothetical protein